MSLFLEIRNYRNKFILIIKRFGKFVDIVFLNFILREDLVVKCWFWGNLIIRFGIGESIYIVCRYVILCFLWVY